MRSSRSSRRVREPGRLPSPRAVLCASLCLLVFPGALPQAGEEDVPERTEAGGNEARPIRSALWRHRWHLAAVFGAELLTREYGSAYGASTDPLLFPAPPGLDERLREELSGSNSRNFVWDNGLEALRYGAPLALVAMGLGDGGQITRDLIGFAGTFYTNRSATRLLKDIIGRERPRLEFAEEDGKGPNAIEELEEGDKNRRSFPSGHASGSFAFAAYLERAVARELGLKSAWRKVTFTAIYGFAANVAWSRLRIDKHYFTDVIAGAALGTWIARRFYRHTHPEEFGGSGASRRHRARRVTLHPPSMVPGGGIALGLGIRLEGPSR